MDLHGDALGKIAGDMDDMESKKMYPSGGATITITVAPSGGELDEGGNGIDEIPNDAEEATDPPSDLPDGLKMADGGEVPAMQAPFPTDETSIPPFLRKKRPV